MTTLPEISDHDSALASLIEELTQDIGEQAVVDHCVALLAGESREDHADALPALTGFHFSPRGREFSSETWDDSWVRSWGARGLLYVWADGAEDAVLAGLKDPHWRPAEMCLKVARHQMLRGAVDQAVRLSGHELARVRQESIRLLGHLGDQTLLPTLSHLANDPDRMVRRAADRAIGRIEERCE